MPSNQTPKHLTHDRIDAPLRAAGWTIGDFRKGTVRTTLGLAMQACRTKEGNWADYVFFVDSGPLRVIEAKKDQASPTWNPFLNRMNSPQQSSKTSNRPLKVSANY